MMSEGFSLPGSAGSNGVRPGRHVAAGPKDSGMILAGEYGPVEQSGGSSQCPRCGSDDTVFDIVDGNIWCSYCRFRYSPLRYDVSTINSDWGLEGFHVDPGASAAIAQLSSRIMTARCSRCGSDVVFRLDENLKASCHWCRSVLSLDSCYKGSPTIPDAILPFSVTPDQAQSLVDRLVASRRFFADPFFRREYRQGVKGVYLPYMVLDCHAHASLEGTGEVHKGSYGDKDKVYFFDEYAVGRSFDMVVSGLQVESSLFRQSDHVRQSLQDQSRGDAYPEDDGVYPEYDGVRVEDAGDVKPPSRTGNIVNSILPFDTENMVSYDSAFLNGFNAEPRNLDVKDVRDLALAQCMDIARASAKGTLDKYRKRGVRWDYENLDLRGERWVSALMPVYLYSYLDSKRNSIHYIAVNGRTGETAGSVPVDKTKLTVFSALISLLMLPFAILHPLFTIACLGGPIFYWYKSTQYTGSTKRHDFVKETKYAVMNTRGFDRLVKKRQESVSSEVSDRNDSDVRGGYGQEGFVQDGSSGGPGGRILGVKSKSEEQVSRKTTIVILTLFICFFVMPLIGFLSMFSKVFMLSH